MTFDIERSMERLDYSTINLPRLRRLPVYKLPPTYRLSGPGSACAGDAPGFPTFFLRHVYTQYGNEPPWRNGKRTAPDYVITDPETGLHHAINVREGSSLQTQLRLFWVPLPYEHERVKLWIQAEYVHFQHCYYNPEPAKYGSHVFIPQGDEWLSDLVSYDNHYAVHAIREFYPEHKPITEWIDTPPTEGYEPNNRFWESAAFPLEEKEVQS